MFEHKISDHQTVAEKLRMAKDFKQKGNEFFKNANYKAALGKYHRSLLYVKGIEDHYRGRNAFKGLITGSVDKGIQELTSEEKEELDALKMDVYNNLAASLLHNSDVSYEKVRLYCDEVLNIDGNNTKALYRKGLTYFYIKEYDEALSCLNKAESNCPLDPNIKKYITACHQNLAKFSQKEKKMYKGMFKKLADSS